MSRAQPSIMVMAGGTGGHIMPGLAVAHNLRQRGWSVSWLGNPTGMEARLVPAHDIELHPLPFGGVRGKGMGTLARLPFSLASACMQASRHLRKVRPDVVLGMGGYVAFPGGLMAALRGTPLVLHEQNAVAGMTNRVLARFARRVLSGFPTTLAGETTGNPVREALQKVPPPEVRMAHRKGPLRLLVVGGSLGAQALNEVLPKALQHMQESGADVPQVVHQAGEKHLPALQDAYMLAGVRATCVAFIDDMAAAYSDADIVICRAGAMTVAEVAVVGAAALFVPFPHAVDDHQTRNAQFLAESGAAWLRQQPALTPQWLGRWLSQRTRPEITQVASRARTKGQPDATQRIADVCAEVAQGKTA